MRNPGQDTGFRMRALATLLHDPRVRAVFDVHVHRDLGIIPAGVANPNLQDRFHSKFFGRRRRKIYKRCIPLAQPARGSSADVALLYVTEERRLISGSELAVSAGAHFGIEVRISRIEWGPLQVEKQVLLNP